MTCRCKKLDEQPFESEKDLSLPENQTYIAWSICKFHDEGNREKLLRSIFGTPWDEFEGDWNNEGYNPPIDPEWEQYYKQEEAKSIEQRLEELIAHEREVQKKL